LSDQNSKAPGFAGGYLLNGGFIKPDGTSWTYEPGRFEIDRHLELLRQAGFKDPTSVALFEHNLDNPGRAGDDQPARCHALIGNLMTRITNARIIRAPRGSEISAKSWLTEAPLRMLMNNLDPDVAERPDDLVVYGGSGRAARDWDSFDRIVTTLRRLEADQTLLVQSGKPVGVFRTHLDAPRVLIANSNWCPTGRPWNTSTNWTEKA
jgi:hypothetical protein